MRIFTQFLRSFYAWPTTGAKRANGLEAGSKIRGKGPAKRPTNRQTTFSDQPLFPQSRTTAQGAPSDFYLETARHLAAYLDGWFGRFDPVEVISEPNLGPADAASRRPELLAKARALGKRLVDGLARGSA